MKSINQFTLALGLSFVALGHSQNLPSQGKFNGDESSQALKSLNTKQLAENLITDQQPNYIVQNNMVLVRVFPKSNIKTLNNEIQSKLNAKDCKIRGKYLTTWISTNQLEDLNSLENIKNFVPIQSPNTNSSSSNSNTIPTNGKIVTQGDRAMLTDIVRSNLNVTGEGIRIGVIADSYNVKNGATAGVLNGELPGANNPYGFTKEVVVVKDGITRNIDEGRAMIEIIHDIAPNAEIYFRSVAFGQEDYADGILELAELGCDIIVDDQNYLNEPFFQDGIITQAINEVADLGVYYFTAALNTGQNSYAAPFVDSGVDLGNPLNNRGVPLPWGRAHSFGTPGTNSTAVVNVPIFDADGNRTVFPVNGQRIRLTKNSSFRLALQWDQPSIFTNASGPTPESDLSILLINSQGRITAWSVEDNLQSGSPFDSLSYTNNTDQTQFYTLVITVNKGPNPKNIRYIDFRSAFPFSPFTGGLVQHANAEGAITVGEVTFNNTPEFGNSLVKKRSSAVGGAPILLDINGKRINPVIRNKPDFMAPGGANTSFFGKDDNTDTDSFPNFSGTSAAAPHAAAAALMLEVVNNQRSREKLTKQAMLNAFTSTAIDMEAKGFDFRTGYGFIQADAAISSVSRRSNIYRFQLIDAATNKVVQTLRDYDEIDLNKFSKGFNIKALTNFSQFSSFSSINFLLEDNNYNLLGRNTDQVTPYALFGDNKGQFNGEKIPNGNYYVFAKPFGNSVGYDLEFKIINGAFPTNEAGAKSLDPNLVFYNNQTTGAIDFTGSLGDSNKSTELVIYNLLGQQVYTKTIEGSINESVDLSEYGKGVYIASLKNSNKNFVKKLLVE